MFVYFTDQTQNHVERQAFEDESSKEKGDKTVRSKARAKERAKKSMSQRRNYGERIARARGRKAREKPAKRVLVLWEAKVSVD